MPNSIVKREKKNVNMLRRFLLLLAFAAMVSSYECSPEQSCRSSFCRKKNVKGWYCSTEKPIRCGDCYEDNNIVKCNEIGQKRTCAPGTSCVQHLGTCIKNAGSGVRPCVLVFVCVMMGALALMMTGPV